MMINKFMTQSTMRVLLLLLVAAVILFYAGSGFAQAPAPNPPAGDVKDIGSLATQVSGAFRPLIKLIIAGAYIAGIGFSLGAIMKFKQHKDNPTQIPIGTPIAMVFIAAALIFLPMIITLTGGTMFGPGAKQKAGGPTGGGATLLPDWEK